MAQFGRPEADLYDDSFVDQAAGTTNLYTTIDETSANDSDYIESPSAPTSDVYVCRLSDMEDPEVSTGHQVRYRIGKSTTGGAQIDCTVQLREGYVDEGTPGTLIEEWVETDIDAATSTTQTLGGTEADTITDYTDLFLRFVFNQA